MPVAPGTQRGMAEPQGKMQQRPILRPRLGCDLLKSRNHGRCRPGTNQVENLFLLFVRNLARELCEEKSNRSTLVLLCKFGLERRPFESEELLEEPFTPALSCGFYAAEDIRSAWHD